MQGARPILAFLAGAAAVALAAMTAAPALSAGPLGPGEAGVSATQKTKRQGSGKKAHKKKRKRPAFRRYVACGTAIEADPARHCRRQQDKGAFFRSNRRTVRFKVCVVFPARQVLCAKRQRATKGELYVNEITTQVTGVHRVIWFVRGKRVGSVRFRVTP